MSDFLFHLLAFIVAIGALIVVHEFGHFWVARTLGIKVLRFSVGFGKPLWTRRFGADRTEFVVAALPLGGYVKMLDEREGEVPRAQRDRAFNRQPVSKRIAVVVAGPLFNFLFALVAFWAVYLVGVDGLRPVIGRVLDGSIAEQAGLKAGDELVAIDGMRVQSWDQRRIYLFERALARKAVTIEARDGTGATRAHRLDLSTIPVAQINSSLVERGIGLVGYFPPYLPIVGALQDGPAKRAGMQVGDRLLRIEGEPIGSWESLARRINDHPGEPLRFTLERDGQRLDLTVTPDPVEHNGRKIGRIFIYPKFAEIPPEMRVTVRLGPFEAAGEGLRHVWTSSRVILEMLYEMLRLEASTSNISGPITIAQYAGYSARIGVDQFMLFLVAISISLGVLNLLPIPVLDGGHLLYYVLEGVKGSPLSERTMVVGQQLGIALLMALMVLAFYNDIVRLLG
jgi:regulator of sigma E protease